MQFKFGMHKLIDHDEYSHARQIPRMRTVRDHETSLNFSKYTVIHKKRGSAFVTITPENLDGF